jgi:hypothetical protein
MIREFHWLGAAIVHGPATALNALGEPVDHAGMRRPALMSSRRMIDSTVEVLAHTQLGIAHARHDS